MYKYCTRTLEELGTGEFGVVTHGKWIQSSNQEVEVAVKTLNNNASDKDRLRFLQEAAIMCQFDHQNLIKLHGVVTEAPIMIVLEYMSHGDLQNLLINLWFEYLRTYHIAKLLKLNIIKYDSMYIHSSKNQYENLWLLSFCVLTTDVS